MFEGTIKLTQNVQNVVYRMVMGKMKLVGDRKRLGLGGFAI